VALFLLSRGAAAVSGIEVNLRLAQMAERTAGLNDLTGRLNIVCGDVNQVKSWFRAGQFDLVTANPPYRLPDTGRISPHAGIALARHESTAGLREFLRAGAFLLRNRGRLAMIHIPERLPEICAQMRSAGVEPKRLRFVHPFCDKAAKMMLIEGVKGARAGLAVMPPLCVYQSPGEYHQEILSYYR
jgi:tRNA1(Val) A37 N6-methylase TrmN6